MKLWNGSNIFIDYPLHDCTEEDFANFYPYDEESSATENNWEVLLNFSVKDTLRCLDKSAYEQALMKPNSISKLSFYLVPCDNLPWGPYEVGEECIADKEK